MNKHIFIGMMTMAAGMLTAASCTDFDDYNEVPKDVFSSDLAEMADKTLWENIQDNEELSDFKELVLRAGFDKALGESQNYTVWAPKNGSFDLSDYDGLTDKALLKQFVQNHIARFNHPAIGTVKERVLMLNEKSYDFEGSSDYTFNGLGLEQGGINLPSNNGLMHIIESPAVYYPNLYEFITDDVMTEGKDIDRLHEFYKRKETVTLNESKSVVGPIVDGLQTYVDSVMDTNNELWSTLNAKIQVEDSTYTFLMPTEKAWTDFYNRIKSYYNYLPKTVAQGYETLNDGTVKVSSKNVERSVDNAYWQDSLTNYYLTRYMIYSNKNPYNQWMTGEPSTFGTDTLYTTTRTKLSNPTEMLEKTVETLPMSNGQAIIVDSMAVKSWETFAPELSISASGNRARVAGGSAKTIRVTSEDPYQEDYSYLYVNAGGGLAELDIFLPRVQSTTYDIYCVFAPPVDQWANNPEYEARPSRIIFTLSYCNKNGALAEQQFIDDREENVQEYMTKFNLRDRTSTRLFLRSFSNNPEKLDTVKIGQFTFPCCYAGLDRLNSRETTPIYPNLKITSTINVMKDDQMKALTGDLRIAAIILKPKELVEFEESNKE